MDHAQGFQSMHRSKPAPPKMWLRRLVGGIFASLAILCVLAPTLPALAHADPQWNTAIPTAPRTLAGARVAQAGNPAGALRIEPMAAYNFIVDSNVETPATYAPTSAMLALHVCNDGATPLTNVAAMIGNFDPQ